MSHHRPPSSSHNQEDSSVKKFITDIKDGDEKQFDVTSTSGFFKTLIVRIQDVDISGRGAQLAFFFLLSLFPLLIFLITLLPYLKLDEDQIFLFIRDYAPGGVGSLIESNVKEVLNNRNGGLLSVGILATVWSASKGVNALTKALNRSYLVKEKRNFFVARGLSIAFTLMLIMTIVVALVLPVFGEQIGTVLFSLFGLEEGFMSLWGKIRWIVPPILIFGVFSMLYWLVPDIKLHYKSVIPGSLFATIGWIVTSLGFSYYINNFGNYTSTYGSIGGIIVLIMWLYLSGIILMLGGQINAVMTERNEAKEKQKSNAAHS